MSPYEHQLWKIEANFSDDVIFHNSLIYELCANYKLWEVSKIYSIANRKNIQVVLLSISDNTLDLIKQPGTHSKLSLEMIRQYQHIISTALKEPYLSKVENYYKSTIHHFCTFFPEKHNGLPYYLTVKIFNDPVFKKIDAFQTALERRITNLLSKRFLKELKYGPEHITVAIAGNRYAVFFIHGIIAPFQIAYASRNEENHAIVIAMTNVLLDKVIDPILSDEKMDVIEKYMDINYEKNYIVILSIIRQITDENINFLKDNDDI